MVKQLNYDYPGKTRQECTLWLEKVLKRYNTCHYSNPAADLPLEDSRNLGNTILEPRFAKGKNNRLDMEQGV